MKEKTRNMLQQAEHIKGSSVIWPLIAVGVILSNGLIAPAHADGIYRWMGKGGVVSYGSTPPKGTTDVVQISGIPTQTVRPALPQNSTTPVLGIKRPSSPRVDHPTSSQNRELTDQIAIAKAQYAEAIQAYVNGKAVRTGNEKNYARYLQRVDELKRAVQLAKAKLDMLYHHLAMVKSGHSGANPTN